MTECSKCKEEAKYKLVLWVEMGWDEGPMIGHLCQDHAKEYTLMHMDCIAKDEDPTVSGREVIILEDKIETFLGGVPYSELVPVAAADPSWGGL